MSLTRDEWLEILKSINQIEKLALSVRDISKRGRIIAEVDKMRKQIYSVIGQV